MKRLFFALFVMTTVVTFSQRSAFAAPPFVDRRLTLPKLNLAFDGALAVGHYDFGPVGGPNGGENAGTGPGLDFEFAIGIIRHLELGFRQGVRLTDDARIVQADGYGRMYDLQNFGDGGDTFSNPEARIRYQFVDFEIVEVGVDGRVVAPFVPNTRFAFLAGVPVAIHIPRVLRVDTGGYIGFAFYDPTVVYFHIPANLWVQLSPRFWLGPVTGVSFYNQRNGNVTNETANVSVGFGLGYQVASFVDLKFLPIDWPAINQDRGVTNFGFSGGLEIRIE